MDTNFEPSLSMKGCTSSSEEDASSICVAKKFCTGGPPSNSPTIASSDHVLEHHSSLEEFFSRVPLDVEQHKSIIHVLHHWAVETPDKVCVLYPDPAQNYHEYLKLTFREVWVLSDKLYGFLRDSLLSKYLHANLTVGVLLTDNLFAFFLTIALLRADVTQLMLSPRNSVAGFQELVDKTACSIVLCEPKHIPKVKPLINVDVFEVPVLTILDIGKMQPSGTPLRPPRPNELYDYPYIFHSSGSTKYPQPVKLSNIHCLVSGMATLNTPNSESRLSNLLITPLYHVFGLLGLFAPAICGCVISVFPLDLQFPPRPSAVVNSIAKSNCIRLSTVPLLLEALVQHLDRNPKDWPILQGVSEVVYGGAHLSAPLLRKLQDRKVRVFSGYGTTETGFCLAADLDCENPDPMAMVPAPFMSYKMVPQPDEPELYELIVLTDRPGFNHEVQNCSDGYSTKDLFMKGPNGSWIFYGRRDDTLVHANGEKTNALALENAIADASPAVGKVAVVGTNRPMAAALVELDEDYCKAKSRDELLAEVRRAVTQANETAPTHSRIMPAMIKILEPGESLPLTNKGNVKRVAVNQQYADTIERLYAESETGGTKDRPYSQPASHDQSIPLLMPPLSSTRSFETNLISRLSHLMDVSPGELKRNRTIPLFDLGMTSQMTVGTLRILEDLLHKPVDPTFIFEYPCIADIVAASGHPGRLSSNLGDTGSPTHSRIESIEAMKELLNKYKGLIADLADFMPDEYPVRDPTSPKVVLVTGASGALGCHLVQRFVDDESVKKVYCLLRGQDPSKRLESICEQRGLTFIKSPKVEALSYDMHDSRLGVGVAKFNELKRDVTLVVHNAWKMNFNLRVQDFDRDCIRSTYNLIKLCCVPNVPKKDFVFVSSVSAVGAYTEKGAIPPSLFGSKQLEMAIPMGYGQSKCVTELMIADAEARMNFNASIFRCGQLSGDTQKGVWTPTDLVALLTVAGGVQLGQIPQVGMNAAFVPMDIAAASIVEILAHPQRMKHHVYHISNPHNSKWDDWMQCLKEAGLNFESVSVNTFLKTLSMHPQNDCHLLASFLRKLDRLPVNHNDPNLCTDLSSGMSEALAGCPQLNKELASLYLDYWKSLGLFEKKSHRFNNKHH